MEPLTPSDVKRWDLNAIHAVFQTASNRADTLQRLGQDLQQVHTNLRDWQGETGEAFRADVGKVRRDIAADGAESRQVAVAVPQAEADVSACKRELDDIERAADANGWTITPDWRIDVGDTGIGRDPVEFVAAQQELQSELNALRTHAHSADHELATAIRGAVGEVSPEPQRQSQTAGTAADPHAGDPRAQPGSTPRTWQDMLLPGGAEGGGRDGAPGPGPADPTDNPPSLEDLFLPTGRAQPSGPDDQQPPPGSLPDVLSRLHQPVVLGAFPPRLKPPEVESFKAVARQALAAEGVPPDEIEARLDDVVARTQQWIDNGMPHYVPPEVPPSAHAAPGFGEGFGDRWRATEQGIKNLLGQGGPGAPGVLESWEQMLKGTAKKASETAAQGPIVAGINDLTREIGRVADSPSLPYYFGTKASDGAFALPGLLFGGEGAAAGELGEIGPGVLDTGPAVSQRAAIGLDQPITYDPWAEQAALDLNYARVHGGPTPDLSQQVADMSTHYVGDNPDRVVLGKWEGNESGYIGGTRAQGGIYFDTGAETWNAITHGLTESQAQDLAWQANGQFLRTQMENHVSRIEYVLPEGFDSVDEVARIRRETYSALEINYLNQNAGKFGYKRDGNAWVYEGG